MLKKELMKKLEESKEIANSHYSLVAKYREELKVSENDIEALKREKESSENQRDNIEKLMDIIVKILAGQSKLESKAEVITDLLEIEVHKAKENLKQQKNNPNYYTDKRYYG